MFDDFPLKVKLSFLKYKRAMNQLANANLEEAYYLKEVVLYCNEVSEECGNIKDMVLDYTSGAIRLLK